MHPPLSTALEINGSCAWCQAVLLRSVCAVNSTSAGALVERGRLSYVAADCKSIESQDQSRGRREMNGQGKNTQAVSGASSPFIMRGISR